MNTINANEFDREVLKSEAPVLVDFFATWCGPCKMLGPVLESVAQQYQGRAQIVKVDIDASPELAQTYGITAVPTLLVFSGGKVVQKAMGFQSQKQLIALLDGAATPTQRP
jgi:thioredoxin 1